MAGENFNLNQPLIISFLVHLCLWLVVLLLPAKNLHFEQPTAIEVVYQKEIKKDNSKSLQMVHDTSTPMEKELLDLKTKAKYLSAVAQRVLKEQIARRNGPSVNRNGQSPTDDEQTSVANQKTATNAPATPHPDQQDVQRESAESSDYPRPSITAPQMSNVGKNAQMGDSSISDFIPNVREGGFTSLNQDQFIYYTFYSRINEQIRNRWVYNIRRFLEQSPQNEVNRLSTRPQITEVEVLLTKEGQFVKALIHRQSENVNLDEGVVSAFRLAAPFQNPPLEIVEGDGYIHLYYSFHLQFRPSFVAGSK